MPSEMLRRGIFRKVDADLVTWKEIRECNSHGGAADSVPSRKPRNFGLGSSDGVVLAPVTKSDARIILID